MYYTDIYVPCRAAPQVATSVFGLVSDACGLLISLLTNSNSNNNNYKEVDIHAYKDIQTHIYTVYTDVYTVYSTQ